ncbi:hypothetical protein Ait01nite_013990 [Actinoplanes italicus]|uniref:Uncharacterized protein n=1 Tax=Actinoplanes italicus TaxID=113567 RepID=A0A2T0KHB8_9ACTN|nr:hypothetical protein [Actinoplanes italicus]PRX22832.1 hypothetical protein CLV67_104360 [Actinoplanes italicus]GIE28354.1 hypothetical protein Ait01nite_013990 [Actinoplanes italicus]
MQTDETTAIPAGVTALAEQRGLGAAVARRDNPGAVKAVLYSLVTAVSGFAVSFGLFYLAGTYFRPLIPLAILALATGICGLGWAIVFPLRGNESAYLYERGIVHVRNGRPRAALWSDLESLEVHVIREGNLMAGVTSAYLLRTSGRPPMRVQPVLTEQPDGTRQDPFGSAMARLVADAGRPVVEKPVGKG